TVDEALPVARNLVRQTAGRTPLGRVERGQKVVIFATNTAWLEPNFNILKAIVLAFKERQIEALFVLPQLKQDWVQDGPGYDPAGLGGSEAGGWINGFSRPDEAKAWLRKKNPQLWGKLFAPGANPYGLQKEASGAMPAGASPVTDKIKKAVAADSAFT